MRENEDCLLASGLLLSWGHHWDVRSEDDDLVKVEEMAEKVLNPGSLLVRPAMLPLLVR